MRAAWRCSPSRRSPSPPRGSSLARQLPPMSWNSLRRAKWSSCCRMRLAGVCAFHSNGEERCSRTRASGNVGLDEDALRFFSLTPPLRVRELRWHRSGQRWTFVVEDSANRTVPLSLPKHPGQPSAIWDGTSRLEHAEGTWEDRMLLLAAQMALRSCADTDGPSGQCPDAMRALRARMERILQVLRRD